MSAFVLCRRVLSEIGDPPRYCGKSIKKANSLNWCPACAARLPYWPTDDAAQEAEDMKRGNDGKECPDCGEAETCDECRAEAEPLGPANRTHNAQAVAAWPKGGPGELLDVPRAMPGGALKAKADQVDPEAVMEGFRPDNQGVMFG